MESLTDNGSGLEWSSVRWWRESPRGLHVISAVWFPAWDCSATAAVAICAGEDWSLKDC